MCVCETYSPPSREYNTAKFKHLIKALYYSFSGQVGLVTGWGSDIQSGAFVEVCVKDILRNLILILIK